MNILTSLADIPNDRPALIYGASSGGHNFHMLLKKHRKDILIPGFLDSYKDGYFSGLPIYTLDEVEDDPTILVCSSYWREIVKNLRNSHQRRIMIIPYRFLKMDSLDALSASLENPLVNPLCEPLIDEKAYNGYRRYFEMTESLLTGIYQKKLYNALTSPEYSLKERLKFIGKHYLTAASSRQYFEFIDFRNVKTIIEGGVYDGKNSLEFINTTNGRAKIFGFDPLSDAIKTKEVGRALLNSQNFVLIKKGLWSSSTKLKFSNEGYLSSVIPAPEVNDGPNQNTVIQTTTIDEYVKDKTIERVDLIKMDIEGSEKEALKGAFKTITQHRPQIAISIYHRMEDFFDIPLYLHAHLDRYNFFLGHYTPDIYETVWYGTPWEIRPSV